MGMSVRSHRMSASQELAIEAVKIAPPAVVSGAIFAGMTVDQWIATLTLIYLLGLVLHQLPRHCRAIASGIHKFKAWRKKRELKRGRGDGCK